MTRLLRRREAVVVVAATILVAVVVVAAFVQLRGDDGGDAAKPTGTGIREVDQVIDILLDGSRVDLLSALRMQMVPCAMVEGLGGPPKCWQAAPPQAGDGEKTFPPPGTPPQGTPIEVFPISTCELEWRTDPELVVDWLTRYPAELFAVVSFESGPFVEAYLPRASHGVVLEELRPDAGRLGVMVLVQDGAIVYVDWLCGGDATVFFGGAFTPYRDARVILHGPAWR